MTAQKFILDDATLKYEKTRAKKTKHLPVKTNVFKRYLKVLTGIILE